MFTGKPEHVKGFDYLGRYHYFLTFCTDHRRRLFVTADAVSTVRTQIERAAAEQSIALLAYRYMPDHVHFLAEGKANDSDCLRFIARAKQFSGFHYKARFNQRLWQRFAATRLRSAWPATSWRTRSGEAWLSGLRTTRTRDRPSTHSSRSSRQYKGRTRGTEGPAEAGYYFNSLSSDGKSSGLLFSAQLYSISASVGGRRFSVATTFHGFVHAFGSSSTARYSIVSLSIILNRSTTCSASLWTPALLSIHV